MQWELFIGKKKNKFCNKITICVHFQISPTPLRKLSFQNKNRAWSKNELFIQIFLAWDNPSLFVLPSASRTTLSQWPHWSGSGSGSAGLWLVEADHVTSVLASYWRASSVPALWVPSPTILTPSWPIAKPGKLKCCELYIYLYILSSSKQTKCYLQQNFCLCGRLW